MYPLNVCVCVHVSRVEHGENERERSHRDTLRRRRRPDHFKFQCRNSLPLYYYIVFCVLHRWRIVVEHLRKCHTENNISLRNNAKQTAAERVRGENKNRTIDWELWLFWPINTRIEFTATARSRMLWMKLGQCCKFFCSVSLGEHAMGKRIFTW